MICLKAKNYESQPVKIYSNTEWFLKQTEYEFWI